MVAPKMMDRATQLFGHTREFAKERANLVRTFVHDKPYLTTFLGLGAGLMLGMLLTPRVPKVQVEIRSNGKAF
jgi:ElaB/YqjD/DUF883 family membrane-anchored ribosome-binding protein